MRGQGMMRTGVSLLATILSAGASAAAQQSAEQAKKTERHQQHEAPVVISRGGYYNYAHGFDRSRKIKGRMKGQQKRRSKAQRAARAA